MSQTEKLFTVTQFFRRFPTDDACLDHLMAVRYGDTLECPKCQKTGKWSRVRKIPAYACSWCGHHIHPKAGTPFQKSRTPLQKWFYAMYLFTTSRHGVPAMELHRQLGVTYKTAWRMGHEIRKYMGMVDGDSGLSGHVEADETFVGGRIKGKSGKGARNMRNKSIVLGIVERGGKIYTKIVSHERKGVILPVIKSKVAPGSTLSTDTAPHYMRTERALGFTHGRVNHNADEWVNGHCCPN